MSKSALCGRKRLGENRNCLICGKEFYALPAQMKKDSWGRYCSRKCQILSQKKGKIVKCLVCGKNIYLIPSDEKLGRGKYCSRLCYVKSQIGRYVGSRGSNWKGGISPINKIIRRSLNYKLWRKSVFERDIWTCQKCGKVGGELHPHHIKSFSEYPKLRFITSNGLTLCRECHKKTENYGNKKSVIMGGENYEIQLETTI